VAYALSDKMKIIDLEWPWKLLTTSTVSYPSHCWASCYFVIVSSQRYTCFRWSSQDACAVLSRDAKESCLDILSWWYNIRSQMPEVPLASQFASHVVRWQMARHHEITIQSGGPCVRTTCFGKVTSQRKKCLSAYDSKRITTDREPENATHTYLFT